MNKKNRRVAALLTRQTFRPPEVTAVSGWQLRRRNVQFLYRRCLTFATVGVVLPATFGASAVAEEDRHAAVAPEPQRNVAQEYRAAFEAMIADPTDPEHSFQFATLAAAQGDLRGAIAALERILKINPGLSNIRLQLGELYLRAGATDLAAVYLRQALLAPDVPGPLRQRAQSLLGQADRAQHKHFFTGSLYAGGRYDSNANAGPSSRDVRVLGQQGLLNEQAVGHSDWSAEVGATLNYTYAFDSQAGNDLEANFTTFNRRYQDTHLLNLNSFGADVGPRFYLGNVLDPNWSVRPFVSATYMLLNSRDYLGGYGGGVNLQKIFASSSYFDLTLETSDQHFFDQDAFPTNSNRTGLYTQLRGSVGYQVLPATRLFTAVSLAQRNSDAGFESFKEVGFGAGVTETYPAPFHWTEYSWSTSLYLGVHRSIYNDADPQIDPTVKRQDNRLDIVLSHNVRITQTLTLTAVVQYTNNNSTLPNFKYHDTSASVGLAWSF
ncbi:tetratricopeptide repeat protein [Paraburkholderia sp. XV]|uniref:tetratricopeptide repeat protein n=1 Tax=Paraburkholderia sp. XV TaxID=2831520 RepID=UPI001CD467E3|nr:porin family protein [Paraburkholderia sp. XV]